jgi:hypothetical protein
MLKKDDAWKTVKILYSNSPEHTLECRQPAAHLCDASCK